MIVRFLQDIPSIVGSNTKIYGPFKAEDIATLPIDNAESLIKRGIALKVEVQ
jgi:DNA replication factor GINS